MANFRANGGGNVSVRYKTIATANANQTYGQQLTQLKTTFNTLTEEEKMRCMVMYDNYMFNANTNAIGHFTRVNVNASSVIEAAVDCDSCRYLYASITSEGLTITNKTSETNTSPMYLMLLSNY